MDITILELVMKQAKPTKAHLGPNVENIHEIVAKSPLYIQGLGDAERRLFATAFANTSGVCAFSGRVRLVSFDIVHPLGVVPYLLLWPDFARSAPVTYRWTCHQG